MVLRHWCQNMICSTMKIRLACKIWVLYLQNQASYANFCLSRWCEICISKKIWNPEILLKFWDFWLIFCMWPLKILRNKCYITTWGQKWLLPWFLRGGLWGPPMGATESNTPWEVGLRIKKQIYKEFLSFENYLLYSVAEISAKLMEHW